MSKAGDAVNRPYGVLGAFDSPAALLNAAQSARGAGYTKLDACSPFPVHGIDEVLRIGHSKLGWVVFLCGLAGAGLALLMQWYTGAVDYPLVIGGKPFFAFEFSIPITFELTVLLAAFGAVGGMLLFNGLPRLHHPLFARDGFRRVSDDRFVLVIDAADPAFDATRSADFLRGLGADPVEVVES